MNPSGLRIGTPALTTRGLVEEDMREIAEVISVALSDRFESEREALGERTRSLMERYPLYSQLSATAGLAQDAGPDRAVVGTGPWRLPPRCSAARTCRCPRGGASTIMPPRSAEPSRRRRPVPGSSGGPRSRRLAG